MTIEFDLDKFVRNSRRVPTDDLPWDRVRDWPLREGEVRFLTYMMNIESHTILYLRDLLSTSVVEEQDVTSFLSCWDYEEFFHGYYLEKFLKTYCGEDAVRNDASRRLDVQGRFATALQNLVTPLLTKASPDFAATHMTWGAAQEYTTLHAYEAVVRQSEHPMLRELLTRIVKDERRHFAFYYQQAQRRLSGSRFLERQTRFFMERFWSPVGASVMPPGELDFLSWYLFRDAKGLEDVRGVDALISRLPGMEGWRGLEREVLAGIRRQEARGEEAARWAYSRRVPVSGGSAPLAAPAPSAQVTHV